MRTLFELDTLDHNDCSHTYVRDSARSIIIRDGKIAMIHSLKYDYYKFPGGGIEQGESQIDAVIRETREEAGLVIKPSSVKEFGMVHRIQKSKTDPTERFIQDNYYYLCEVEEDIVTQRLDGYESEEIFTLEFVDPRFAISVNRKPEHGPKDSIMIEREARVLEILIEEKYL